MRVRVRYGKQGRLRFVSAIDLGRLWERALRRADLPIAYSEGFSPHPKVSFTDALPLGYASTGEYAELTFAGPVDLEAAIGSLNEAFCALTAGRAGPALMAGRAGPALTAGRAGWEGVAVLQAVAVTEGDPRLAKWLRASCWDLDYAGGTAPADAVAAAREADALPVERQRKGDPVTVDLRPALHQISASDDRVRVTLHHVEPQVRPTETDLALRRFRPDLPEPRLVTRVAQGRPVDEGLSEALSGELVEPLHPIPRRQPT
ncbi:MAG: TIGR03936 family radical SAM-associated protein [Haloechinothrix sp.]